MPEMGMREREREREREARDEHELYISVLEINILRNKYCDL